MKTYESFIFSNKKKKISKILDFSQDVKNFVKFAIKRKEEDWIVDYKDSKSKYETTLSVVSISVDANSFALDFIRIYYNKQQEHIYFDLNRQYNETLPTLRELLDFFEDILRQYLLFEDDHRYKIKITELDSVLKELTFENIDFHSTVNNYNL